MKGYLIPANANRGKLLMGFFRPIDLIIFGTGLFITFILLVIFQQRLNNIWIVIAVMLPAGLTGLLVLPIPHQHNVLVLLTAIYMYLFVNRKRYYWRGWCERYGDEQTTSKQ